MYEERVKFYNLNDYQSYFFDYLFSQSDEISFISLNWSEQNDYEETVNKVLSFYLNESLQPFLKRYEIKEGWNNNDIYIKLYFSTNPKVSAWLKQHKTIFSFDTYHIKKEQGIIIHKRDEKFLLQDLCFYKNYEPIFSTITHAAQVVVAKNFEPFLYDWYANFITEKFKPIFLFIEEWNKMKSINCTESKFIDYFSSDKYDYDLFFKIFDINSITINHWDGFYLNTKNIEMFAKVLTRKLKKDNYPYEQVLRVFQWYELHSTLRTYERPFVGEGEITAFLLELPSEKFQQSFKAVLQELKCGKDFIKKDVYYLDKLFFLWNTYGLSEEKIRFEVFHAIRKVWFDVRERTFKQRRLRSLLGRFIKLKSSTKVKDWYARRERNSEVEPVIFIDLAYAYYYGILYQKNYKKAVEYFKKALTVCKIADCQYDLAYCYEQGLGVEKNLKQAEHWYLKAEENGHPKAGERLESIARISGDIEM